MVDQQPNEPIEIIEFQPRYARHFRDLNYEWLEEYFEIEPFDRIILNDPQKQIIRRGGFVFFARTGDEIVGTCALLKHAEKKFELAKMGVTAAHRSRGVGRQLALVAIEKARLMGADTLVLATDHGDWPFISIPLRREDPAGAADFLPPHAPLLFLPADGAVFTASPTATIDVAWSELDDCSGIDYYKLEIAPTPQFTNILCCREPIEASVTQVIAEEGDVGTVYWRVYAVDNAGLKGPTSEVRSWTVVRP